MSDIPTPTPLMSIEEQWQILTKGVYPDGMIPDQYRQLRQAFYAGFTAALTMAMEVSAKYEEEVGMRYLDDRLAEIAAFRDELQAEARRSE